MFMAELIWALAIALLLGGVFMLGFRRGSAGAEVVFFFTLLFLLIWAGGVWVTPLGPLAWGVPWVSFLLVGLIMVLLLGALLPPPHPPRSRREAAARTEARVEAAVMLNAFFWVLVVLLVISIITHYARL